MILVLLGIGILTFIIGIVLINDNVGDILCDIGIIMTAISIIATVCLGIAVSNQIVIDDKIAMYLEENTKIEEQVNILVTDYMRHESEVYSNVKAASPVVLAQMYPEIKADDLIRSQIDIYVANNERIKSLNLQKINGSVYRWWLYFGK